MGEPSSLLLQLPSNAYHVSLAASHICQWLFALRSYGEAEARLAVTASDKDNSCLVLAAAKAVFGKRRLALETARSALQLADRRVTSCRDKFDQIQQEVKVGYLQKRVHFLHLSLTKSLSVA
ncbi:unnamed protein product [Protopolystoma xenopodis]|uniref:Uncharacterized protein n=1 Tax=Protopolystoma xenopodis TaxID=117903 RepID=A0A3S5AH59_9PLAT|nr:unnamed protein product [Protopolystoma xenopodis]